MSLLADFISQGEPGPLPTVDAMSLFLPLARQTVEAHDAGFVAPLAGLDALHVDEHHLWFAEADRRAPREEMRTVRALQQVRQGGVDIVGARRETRDLDAHGVTSLTLRVGERGHPVERPIYLPGYVSWEHEIGHHDPITDVFSLGLLLASLVCGLDFRASEDLRAFVDAERNAFRFNPQVHPVIAKAILRMTELHRSQRPQEPSTLVHALEHYRDQDVDFGIDLARIAGFRSEGERGRRETLLATLQQRLFEVSRRNRLLHFKATLGTVNVSAASVPLSLDVERIKADDLLTWNARTRKLVVSNGRIPLNTYLRFEEQPYLPGVLDRLRSEVRRDRAEYGFAQLRLVLCFLRWADLKQSPPERYESPLVLLPVELVKRKGIRDVYELEVITTEAEINPVLRYMFKQHYGLELPEAIDLAETDLDALHEHLVAAIAKSEPAVSLALIDRPRIELLHTKAQRRLDQYWRKARLSGRGVRRFLDVDYSYREENYQPLGLRLFRAYVAEDEEPRLQRILESSPKPRVSHVAEPPTPTPEPAPAEAPPAPPVVEAERTFYTLKERGDERNPYAWEFDLCQLTLANFRYRKMSLVRDYDTLLEDMPDHEGFDALFSPAPRPHSVEDAHADPRPDLDGRFHVVPCDPTQAASIETARAGGSMIIQGPPGTGKSQTITNLIADYVARGQRVLFVCEKRAAIDVVFHRLRQRGLHELCALIHDAQEQKKPFIMELRDVYERLLTEGGDVERLERRRRETIAAIETELEPLMAFDDAMRETPDGADLPFRQLLARRIALDVHDPPRSPADLERFPHHGVWSAHAEPIARVVSAVRDIDADAVFARHPLLQLAPSILTRDRPLEHILGHLDGAERHLEALRTGAAWPGGDGEASATVGDLLDLVDYGRRAADLAARGRLDLLDPTSREAAALDAAARQRAHLVEKLEEARTEGAHWIERLPRDELRIALDQARSMQGPLAILKPGWWRLRRVMNERYDFRSHAVRPSRLHVLIALEREYAAADAVDDADRTARDAFGCSGPLDAFATEIAALRRWITDRGGTIAALHESALESAEARRHIEALAELGPTADGLESDLAGLFDDPRPRRVLDTTELLRRIRAGQDDLPDALACLSELAALPPDLQRLFREEPTGPAQLEAAMADRTIDAGLRARRSLRRFTAAVRRRHLARLDRAYEGWEDVNAELVRERAHARFFEHVRICGLPAAQLEPEQKPFKAAYNRGRRVLEHEFGKTMRYKSIRALSSGDSGLVLRDLKPVWLMSPLSVSDTLPLEPGFFDVVIFDEASQIPLEDAIPTVFRAPQAIVVGDQMQLPPTNFFAARRSDDDDLEFDGDGAAVEYDLDANSFLSHAARTLSSTMLGWHYRSRSESLISFSNGAFYHGRLLTVPERRLESARPPIDAVDVEAGDENVDELLARAVSFHYLESGVYHQRRNREEAAYIARLVRGLLEREDGTSLGIVAFSEAQQGAIEQALEELAAEDPAFRRRLAAEYEREEDGQFVGLLVKNLENIQGDERDIVIMSVCYAHAPNGKMRMNFGPINQTGGEKRLNVAFSRAKWHMVLVSSIRAEDITNDYNDGAACLKNYFRYAEASSGGDAVMVRTVLGDVTVRSGTDRDHPLESRDAVVTDLARRLEALGFEVETNVGHSHFRCDVAVRRPDEHVFALAILVDTEAHYADPDLLGRDLMKPKLLRAFGWTVVQVLTKDWTVDRAGVLEGLERVLAGEFDEAADDEHDERQEVEARDEAMSEPTEEDVDVRPEARPEVGLPAPAAPTTTRATTPPAGRRFEYVRDSSAKFWEITLDGERHRVHFGRIGTAGQIKTKVFANEEDARRDAERLVRSKVAKGYREVDGEAD